MKRASKVSAKLKDMTKNGWIGPHARQAIEDVIEVTNELDFLVYLLKRKIKRDSSKHTKKIMSGCEIKKN